MNSLDAQYKNILQNIHDNGIWSNNRTGIRSKTIPSAMIVHDMSEGFPLMTIKRVPFKSMAVELEGFLKGKTSKKWFQDRGCTIWNEWANPQKIPYGNDEDSKKKMLEEDDLGMIYGSVWRNFHDPENTSETVYGVDQLKTIILKLLQTPEDRRMLCLAWNPLALDYQALPPCHVLWQVSVLGNKLNLSWYQRSVDTPLGLSYNISSYGLLLHLLAKISGYQEGTLTGFLNNVHYYENQLEGVEKILSRNPDIKLPSIKTQDFNDIDDWTFDKSQIIDYNPLPTIKMPVAV